MTPGTPLDFDGIVADLEGQLADGTGLGIAMYRKQARVLLNGIKVLRAEEIVKEAIEKAACKIPTTWLDPLLTGPNAVLKGSGPWGCPDIERLLQAIKARLTEAQ